MAGWLLDTNHLSAAVKPVSPIRDRIERAYEALSQVDMMLAALTRQMGLTLLTTDQDFKALPDLRLENWLG